MDTSVVLKESAKSKPKFTKSQIIAIRGGDEAGLSVSELRRKHAISNANYYQCKSKYAGMPADRLGLSMWSMKETERA